jgi:hypothetical protein
MKKRKKLNENMGMGQMGMAMPVNGVAYTPDGKGNVIPTPYVTANNLLKAQVPTPAAAMAGAMGSGMPTISAPPQEEEETEPTEVEEQAKEQFRSALVALLGEENVSSSLLNKLEGIFEAAVQDRVNSHVSATVAQLDENVKSYLDGVTNTLVEKVDDYLDYVVEEWMQENAVAVEQGIKTQIAENFISGLKNLFENHYIDVPDQKYNALDELYSQNRELSQQLNKAINESMSIRKELSLTECAGIFVAETRDLADTQVARLQSLMENVAFGSPEEYREKLVAIKNNYLASQNFVRQVAPVAPVTQHINEEMTFSPVRDTENSTVDGYANAIAKLNKKL